MPPVTVHLTFLTSDYLRNDEAHFCGTGIYEANSNIPDSRMGMRKIISRRDIQFKVGSKLSGGIAFLTFMKFYFVREEGRGRRNAEKSMLDSVGLI
jgi:hypothetical protein